MTSSSLPGLKVSGDGSPTLATFSDLPNEILLVIFSEFHTKRRLRELRFVCRRYNEIVNVLVAERLVIGRSPSTVDGMVSGPNIFNSSCRTLILRCNMFRADHYVWGMLPKLITKMQGICTVELFVKDHLDPKVLDAICSLPAVENLKFTFLRNPVAEQLLNIRSRSLSKLKSLSIQLSAYHPSIDPCGIQVTKGALCYLIANAPALEHLDIGWVTSLDHWERPDLLNFDALFTYLQRRPDFTSCLRSFNCATIELLSPRAIPFFAQLSCLELPNDRADHNVVWPRLRASGIDLTTVKVQWLSDELLDYIHYYQGLQAFHMDISTSSGRYARDQDVQRLLTFALPGHRATLVDLRFCPSQVRDVERRASERQPQIMLWDIPGLLGLLLPYTRIERLDLVCYAFLMVDDVRKATFVSNLNAIISHPTRLKTVHLHLVGVEGIRITSDCLRIGVSTPIHNLQFFMHSIRQFDLAGGTQTSRNSDLQVVVEVNRGLRTTFSGIPLPVTRVVHKVVRIEEKDTYRLWPDFIATELLNELSW